MKLSEKGLLLKIFIYETASYKGKPLYAVIVSKARELRLAGVTVIFGITGLRTNSRVHTIKLSRLSGNDLPVAILIIDTEDKIIEILPFLEGVMEEGLISLEKVKIITHRRRKG